MIILRCQQGSRAWERARLGIPTASRFEKIMTPKSMKPSRQAEGLRNELLAEWVTGYPFDSFTSDWAERGKLLEPEARKRYEFDRDLQVDEVGCVLRDDGMAGASPDGLVGEGGGLELKCPAAKTHVGYLLDPDSLVESYYMQVMGGLLITRRKWWDIMSYCPTFPPVIKRVEPSDEYLKHLAGHLGRFIDDLLEAREKLVEMGIEAHPDAVDRYPDQEAA